VKTRIVMLAPEGEPGEKYGEALKEAGVEFTAVSTVAELAAHVTRIACSGIVVDIASMIRATPEEKSFLSLVEKIFPFARAKWDKAGGRALLHSYRSANPIVGIGEFVESQCCGFKLRKLRSHERRDDVWNVLLRGIHEPVEKEEKSFTLNVGGGGAFLFTAGFFCEGDMVWLSFKEMKDKSLIRAEVRRFVPWGTERRVPGVGVRFTNIMETQVKELSLRA
jgi:hypothetical protein